MRYEQPSWLDFRNINKQEEVNQFDTLYPDKPELLPVKV